MNADHGASKLAPGAGPAQGAPPESDGRRRRSQDSRARIVQAMLELVGEGQTAPAAEQVALRAQVGLRTVFRHFRDVDSLYREMSVIIEAEMLGVVNAPFSGASWRERVLELVRRRCGVYERIAPFLRASHAHRHASPFLADDLARLARVKREILLAQLPAAQKEDPVLVEGLDLLLSFSAWDRLRRVQARASGETVEILSHMVRALVERVSGPGAS